jgi:excisionase family DNA binding protein
MKSRFLTTFDAAEYLGIKKSTLEHARSRGLKGFPPFVRVGHQVRYDVRDLEAYIVENKTTPAA